MTLRQPIAERSRRESAASVASGAAQARPWAATTKPALPDDLAREVYCVLGVPIDALDMVEALRRIEAAAAASTPYLVSTPNLNFLINSRKDPKFRESLLQSDLCSADGMPIIWIARLLGLPIRQRIAGSDIFAVLKARRHAVRPLTVFLFGGADGIADEAARRVNGTPSGLRCVGSLYPGYGTVEEMSHDAFIDRINASGADLLVVALSAGKGQVWLHSNHSRLRTPVRAQLGAAINFEAGSVGRAPVALRRLGLEWLWRIKEEPYLWRRYAHDGGVLLKLLLTRALPLAIAGRWPEWGGERRNRDLLIRRTATAGGGVTLSLSGHAIERNIDEAVAWFRDALDANGPITLDLADTRAVDARFLGLLLMLRKQLTKRGDRLILTHASAYVARMFYLNGAEFLLAPKQRASDQVA